MGQIAASRLSAKARVDEPRTKQQTTNLTSAGFTQHFVYPNQTKPKLIANRSILLSIFEYPCGSVIVRDKRLSGIAEFRTSTTENIQAW
jgi:hypothetical protein